MNDESLLISYKEICAMLGIGQTLFFDLRSAGKFPIEPVRLGRCVRYDRRKVERWVAAGCPAKWHGGAK